MIGVGGGIGHVIEYRGDTIRNLSMEGRMTVCNMSIEGGARAGLVAPDDKTFAYVEGRPYAPKGKEWEAALDYWQSLPTDEGAAFDKVVTLKAEDIEPSVTWGTTPAQSVSGNGSYPQPGQISRKRPPSEVGWRALNYMDLKPGTAMEDIPLDRVFIGSCTNSRIEDLRAAASVVARATRSPTACVPWWCPAPASSRRRRRKRASIRSSAEAGFEWRDAGCSMCLGMNPDFLLPGERAASTSNRNFEGTAGSRRPHASRKPGDGRGRRGFRVTS